MNAPEQLRAKAHEYEVKSASEEERDQLAQAAGEFPSAVPMLFATVALVLREVAEAIELEREAA